MFTSDFAEDFSRLSQSQIRRLEKQGILKPVKQQGCKYYTFGDIYVLRVIKILKRIGLAHHNITEAFEYLRALSPEDPLSSFVLLHDGKELFTVCDGSTLNATKWGQMVWDHMLQLEAVGSELEITRKAMIRFVSDSKQKVAELKSNAKIGHHYSKDNLDQLFA